MCTEPQEQWPENGCVTVPTNARRGHTTDGQTTYPYYPVILPPSFSKRPRYMENAYSSRYSEWHSESGEADRAVKATCSLDRSYLFRHVVTLPPLTTRRERAQVRQREAVDWSGELLAPTALSAWGHSTQTQEVSGVGCCGSGTAETCLPACP